MMSLSKFLTCFILLGLFNISSYASTISVSVDRNPVNINESFQLTFQANEVPDSDPDFSPLEKDFEIINQSQQRSTQINNWKKTQSIEWILTVMAKRSGNLIIPAINFGHDSSEYAALLVNKNSGSTNTADLFLQVEVDHNTPYIEQQVIYRLKLYRKVNISQAALTDPISEHAIIEKLGEDKNYNSDYQGEKYAVTERNYAIFPQKSGELIIPAVILTANVVVPSKRRFNGFFNQQNTRVQKVESKAIHLKVRSKPKDLKQQPWLPAEAVYIEEKWSEKDRHVKVGEPLTRTLSLFVQGAPQSALPELYQENNPDYVKAYPDQPVLKEVSKAIGLSAYREEKIAFIISKAGEYTLPAIEIPWWNTKSNHLEIARIAAQKITVISHHTSAIKKPTSPIINQVIQPLEPATMTTQSNTSWMLFLAVFFAVAWLLTILWVFWTRKLQRNKKIIVNDSKYVDDTVFIAKHLKAACYAHNALATKNQLLHWGQQHFLLHNLTHIAAQCPPELQAEIIQLNKILYSTDNNTWQGEALWHAFTAHKKIASVKVQKNADDALPPLFKL